MNMYYSSQVLRLSGDAPFDLLHNLSQQACHALRRQQNQRIREYLVEQRRLKHMLKNTYMRYFTVLSLNTFIKNSIHNTQK